MHERQFGWKAFRVLVVTTNAQRAETILATIRECVPEHERGLFLIADRQSLVAADILSHPWRDARGQTHALDLRFSEVDCHFFRVYRALASRRGVKRGSTVSTRSRA